MPGRAPRNRTLTLTDENRDRLLKELLSLNAPVTAESLSDRIVNGDLMELLDFLPNAFVDLLILDPPYNLDKDFHGTKFGHCSHEEYIRYLESWFPKLLRLLKPHASVYLCGDWKCSAAEYEVMAKYLIVQNRITWQREKGRGAIANWKNCCEDIWFGTVDREYTFNVDAVKQKRRVLAPYREKGVPKDWQETEDGKYRLTCPSNFWDDISIPYWSMPENTDHPTQKPEKLLAKLVLASSRPGDFVFDPFLGSGTTAVVAKKLGRHFCGIEINQEYCCWAQERLHRADVNPDIQGYCDGVFWERNTLNLQRQAQQKSTANK